MKPRLLVIPSRFEKMSKVVGFMGDAIRCSDDQEEMLDVRCIVAYRFVLESSYQSHLNFSSVGQ